MTWIAVRMLTGDRRKYLGLVFGVTGDNTERVDTRVLQAIYAIEPSEHTVYVGQQLDVFIETSESRARR